MNQLTLINETGLELGSICRWLGNASLVVPADATDAELEILGRYLKFHARGSQWHWGDYIRTVAERKGVSYDAATIARAWGQDKDKICDAVEVAKFFPAERRVESLSFTHHFEAMAAGSLDDACGALEMAVEKGWTKTELRAYLRRSRSETELSAQLSKADGTGEPELAGINDERDEPGPVRDLWVSDLCALDRAAKTRLAEGWVPDADAAVALMKKTRNLRELLRSIEEVAGISV